MSVAVGVPSSSTAVPGGVPDSVTVTPASSLSVMVIDTVAGLPATTPEGSVPNPSTNDSEAPSSMLSGLVENVTVPEVCPLTMFTVPAGLPDSVKSSVSAAVPETFSTGIASAVGAAVPRFTVTVSASPSFTVPLPLTSNDAAMPVTVAVTVTPDTTPLG